MKIWLLEVNETLPGDPDFRPWRYNILAEILAGRGHEVIWWVSTFSHSQKAHRVIPPEGVRYEKGYTIYFLHGPGYKKNISFARIKHHRILANRFLEKAYKLEPPDLIVCPIPILEICAKGLKYAQEKKIPFILDIRDKWPETYLFNVPGAFRPILKLALIRSFSESRKIKRSANNIIAVSEDFLNWGLRDIQRERTSLDRVFHLGYDDLIFEEKSDGELSKIGLEARKKNVLFIGTISQLRPLDFLIKAAHDHSVSGRSDTHFIICGDGPDIGRIKKLAKNLNNIIFTGWVSSEALRKLKKNASIAVAPYRGNITSLPNKIFEYMAAGLPIISSLEGELRDMMGSQNFGIYYKSDNYKGFKAALDLLLDDDELRINMGQNSLKLFNENYQSKNICLGFADYLESFLSRNN